MNKQEYLLSVDNTKALTRRIIDYIENNTKGNKFDPCIAKADEILENSWKFSTNIELLVLMYRYLLDFSACSAYRYVWNKLLGTPELCSIVKETINSAKIHSLSVEEFYILLRLLNEDTLRDVLEMVPGITSHIYDSLRYYVHRDDFEGVYDCISENNLNLLQYSKELQRTFLNKPDVCWMIDSFYCSKCLSEIEKLDWEGENDVDEKTKETIIQNEINYYDPDEFSFRLEFIFNDNELNSEIDEEEMEALILEPKDKVFVFDVLASPGFKHITYSGKKCHYLASYAQSFHKDCTGLFDFMTFLDIDTSNNLSELFKFIGLLYTPKTDSLDIEMIINKIVESRLLKLKEMIVLGVESQNGKLSQMNKDNNYIPDENESHSKWFVNILNNKVKGITADEKMINKLDCVSNLYAVLKDRGAFLSEPSEDLFIYRLTGLMRRNVSFDLDSEDNLIKLSLSNAETGYIFRCLISDKWHDPVGLSNGNKFFVSKTGKSMNLAIATACEIKNYEEDKKKYPQILCEVIDMLKTCGFINVEEMYCKGERGGYQKK